MYTRFHVNQARFSGTTFHDHISTGSLCVEYVYLCRVMEVVSTLLLLTKYSSCFLNGDRIKICGICKDFSIQTSYSKKCQV